MSDHSGGVAGHHAGGYAGHHPGYAGHHPGYAGHHPGYAGHRHAGPGSTLPTPVWPCEDADVHRGRAVPPYAGWGSRVGAHLLDALAAGGAVVVAGFAAGIAGSLTRNAVAGGAVAVLLGIAAVSWLFHNRYVRAGRTGQSLGKSALRIRLVDERTWGPIGTGRALARDLAHVIDGLSCYVGYLMPLWDRRRQTIADKLARTVVVRSGPVRVR